MANCTAYLSYVTSKDKSGNFKLTYSSTVPTSDNYITLAINGVISFTGTSLTTSASGFNFVVQTTGFNFQTNNGTSDCNIAWIVTNPISNATVTETVTTTTHTNDTLGVSFTNLVGPSSGSQATYTLTILDTASNHYVWDPQMVIEADGG